jgi:hypothetical protein
VRVSTWSSLAPLALPSLPEDVARRLIEEHLLDPRRYAAPCGLPSVSMEEPSFRAGWHLFRCWRGPAWMNTAWLLVPPLRRLGYAGEADRIVGALVAAVERHGFREYYNPLDGDGLGARRFGWSTLIVDLLPAPDEPSERPQAQALSAPGAQASAGGSCSSASSSKRSSATSRLPGMACSSMSRDLRYRDSLISACARSSPALINARSSRTFETLSAAYTAGA